MKAALGALAAKFDEWRSGSISSVAVGLIEEESLAAEVREQIASMVEFFRDQERGA